MTFIPHENVSAAIPDASDHHLFYHSFEVTKENAALQIELIPGSENVQLLALLRKDKFPVVNTSSMDYGFDYCLTSPVSMDPTGEYSCCFQRSRSRSKIKVTAVRVFHISSLFVSGMESCQLICGILCSEIKAGFNKILSLSMYLVSNVCLRCQISL